MWLAMRRQWIVATGIGRAAYLGLNFAALEIALEGEDIRGRKKRRRVIRGLRVMEDAALPVLNERG